LIRPQNRRKTECNKIYDDCRSFGMPFIGGWFMFPVLSGEEKPLTIFLMHSLPATPRTAYQLWKPSDSYQNGRFSRRLGAERLLRPGKKLRNLARHCAEEIEWRHHKRRRQPVLADAPERMTQKRAAAPKWFPFGWIPIRRR